MWWGSSIFGLLLSLYLLWLKTTGSSCPLLHCTTVLNSKWGQLFAIPVTAYGACLWISTFSNRTVAYISGLMLAGGSIVLLYIQFVLIGKPCWFCIIHAACAIIFWILNNCYGVYPTRRWLSISLIVSALCIVILIQINGVHYYKKSHSLDSKQIIASIDTRCAFDWFGQATSNGPILVVGLACPHCIELLQNFKSKGLLKSRRGPNLFLATGLGKECTAVFIASAMRADGSFDHKKLAILIDHLPEFSDDIMIDQTNNLSIFAAREFSEYTQHLACAESTLELQENEIKKLNVQSLPFYLSDH